MIRRAAEGFRLPDDFQQLSQSANRLPVTAPKSSAAAIEALILVVTRGGPTMLARIGQMRALNRHHVREFNPKHKEPHWGRRKLARDR
jgi:hypothetical protein